MKTYKLHLKSYDRVVVEENNTLVEYSVKLDLKTITVKKWGGKREENYRLLINMNDPLARWVKGENYLSVPAIRAARRKISKELQKVKQQLLDVQDSYIWQDMADTVDQHVKHYKTDFTLHDSLWLANNPAHKFLWIVRDNGTSLIPCVCPFHHDIIASHRYNCNYYYCDGDEIYNVDYDSLLQEYRKLPKQVKGA